MARGNEIVVSTNPKGVFGEGIITAALKPGTCLQIDVSEGMGPGGRFSYEAYAPGGDGNQRPIIVLLPDHLRGKTADDAYVIGERCFWYCPVAGEELNMLLQDVAGTADDHAFGEILMVDNGTGKLIATTSTPESEPFQLLEAIPAPVADTLAHVLFTGY